MGLIKTIAEYINDYGWQAVSFLARSFLTAASVMAAFSFRHQNMPWQLVLGAFLGWMWVIWHKWE